MVGSGLKTMQANKQCASARVKQPIALKQPSTSSAARPAVPGAGFQKLWQKTTLQQEKTQLPVVVRVPFPVQGLQGKKASVKTFDC